MTMKEPPRGTRATVEEALEAAADLPTTAPTILKLKAADGILAAAPKPPRRPPTPSFRNRRGMIKNSELPEKRMTYTGFIYAEDLARQRGWPTHRARRWLERAHARFGQSAVRFEEARNGGRRYFTTAEALARLLPGRASELSDARLRRAVLGLFDAIEALSDGDVAEAKAIARTHRVLISQSDEERHHQQQEGEREETLFASLDAV